MLIAPNTYLAGSGSARRARSHARATFNTSPALLEKMLARDIRPLYERLIGNSKGVLKDDMVAELSDLYEATR